MTHDFTHDFTHDTRLLTHDTRQTTYRDTLIEQLLRPLGQLLVNGQPQEVRQILAQLLRPLGQFLVNGHAVSGSQETFSTTL
jgi:hypothetical protein